MSTHSTYSNSDSIIHAQRKEISRLNQQKDEFIRVLQTQLSHANTFNLEVMNTQKHITSLLDQYGSELSDLRQQVVTIRCQAKPNAAAQAAIAAPRVDEGAVRDLKLQLASQTGEIETLKAHLRDLQSAQTKLQSGHDKLHSKVTHAPSFDITPPASPQEEKQHAFQLKQQVDVEKPVAKQAQAEAGAEEVSVKETQETPETVDSADSPDMETSSMWAAWAVDLASTYSDADHRELSSGLSNVSWANNPHTHNPFGCSEDSATEDSGNPFANPFEASGTKASDQNARDEAEANEMYAAGMYMCADELSVASGSDDAKKEALLVLEAKSSEVKVLKEADEEEEDDETVELD